MMPEQFTAEFRELRDCVFVKRDTLMTAQQRIIAIAGQAHGDPVIAGEAAKILYGSRWHENDFTIELIRGVSSSGRPARGTVTRRLDLTPSEISEMYGQRITSPIRTMFDIGRRRNRLRAMGELDALAAVVPIDLDELMEFTTARKGVRFVTVLRELIPMIDPKAESPRESGLRLFMHDSGLPKPQSQVRVFDEYGTVIARNDLAYEEAKIAIEYDGVDYHDKTDEQRARDDARDERLRDLGWVVIRVTAKRLREEPFVVIKEIRDALHSRGLYYC